MATTMHAGGEQSVGDRFYGGKDKESFRSYFATTTTKDKNVKTKAIETKFLAREEAKRKAYELVKKDAGDTTAEGAEDNA